MKRILKYELDIKETQEISMRSHQILSVINQNERVMVYAIVSDDETVLTHTFKIYGTGAELPINSSQFDFLGTVSLLEGSLVYHVFCN